MDENTQTGEGQPTPGPITEEAIVQAVDEAIAEAPSKQHFTLIVNWKDGTTEEQKIEAQESFIKNFATELAESPEDHIPLCIEQVTVKRI